MNTKRLMKPEVCYWLGLVQSDGCFKKHYSNQHSRFHYIITLGMKDLEPVVLFQKITKDFWGRDVKIHKDNGPKYDSFYITLGVSRLLRYFSDMQLDFSDPPKPPDWVVNDIRLFGAYLAGIIDGDGSVRVKRPEYPQCLIKIISGKPQDILKVSIENMLNCKCYMEKQYREVELNGQLIKGTSYNLDSVFREKIMK
jgi:hypothetical protein